MEKSIRLSVDTANPDRLHVEMTTGKAAGRTVITISMSVPNQVESIPLAQLQAEVLRMAIADLQEERSALLGSLAANTAAS